MSSEPRRLRIRARHGLLVAAGSLAFSLMSCSGARAIEDPRQDLSTLRHADSPDGKRHLLEGVASWYGEDFHGRRTACGEPFDMYGFTAAHKTLPFHTIVRVVDPETRKSVVVRINDRGPYKPGRVIDLSWAAARDLEIVRRGKLPVVLEVLAWGDGSRCDR